MERPRTAGQNDADDEKLASVNAAQGPPNTEKAEFVDQKAAERFERVRERVAARPGLFAAQGAVVATWRVYRGRRLGPYFRLAYREGGRQRSIYLGRCAELVRRVRSLLARLQAPERRRRVFRRLEAQVRASLRQCKAQLKKLLAPLGIQLKGFEFRGSRRALAGWSSAFRRPVAGEPP
jgi:hypothetical protein